MIKLHIVGEFMNRDELIEVLIEDLKSNDFSNITSKGQLKNKSELLWSYN